MKFLPIFSLVLVTVTCVLAKGAADQKVSTKNSYFGDIGYGFGNGVGGGVMGINDGYGSVGIGKGVGGVMGINDGYGSVGIGKGVGGVMGINGGYGSMGIGIGNGIGGGYGIGNGIGSGISGGYGKGGYGIGNGIGSGIGGGWGIGKGIGAGIGSGIGSVIGGGIGNGIGSVIGGGFGNGLGVGLDGYIMGGGIGMNGRGSCRALEALTYTRNRVIQPLRAARQACQSVNNLERAIDQLDMMIATNAAVNKQCSYKLSDVQINHK